MKTIGGKLPSSWAEEKWWDDKSSSKKTSYRRCYEDHPPMTLPGSSLVIYGGSCLSPAVTDADVYIGFEGTMSVSSKAWPWTPGHEIRFPITDMKPPSNPGQFKKLIEWTLLQLEGGAKVHAGCIGGHGRTGTFLAAIVAVLGEKDAVSYVREHYCKKAVESTTQVAFLTDQFGVKTVMGAKSSNSKAGKLFTSKPKGSTAASEVFDPMLGNGCIWRHLCN